MVSVKAKSLKSGPHVWMFFFLLKIFIYSFMRDAQRDRETHRHRQREKQAPRREPDVGLGPGSPGSHPGPQAALSC